MKVLFCALDIYSGMGGMQRFNQRVLQSLSELRTQGMESSTALVLWDRPEHGTQAPPNVEFLAASKSKLGMIRRFIGQLVRKKAHTTVIYGHVLLAPLAALGRLLRPGSRHILVVHGFEVWDRPNWFWKLLVKSSAQTIVSVSKFTARKMAIAYGIPENRFRILPNAIDLNATDCLKANRTAATGACNFLTVARLSDGDGYKGHEKVILAMPAVLRAFPEAHYYIIGEGSLKDQLGNLAKELGVAEHVHLLGRVDDNQLEQLYAESQIFVMPSKKEGFGIVFLEAWKHSLPVIAGNQDASPEVVQDGLNGLIVDPDDPMAIAQAIVGLLCNPSKMKEMGENGWNTVQRKYTHERFRARFAEVLS